MPSIFRDSRKYTPVEASMRLADGIEQRIRNRRPGDTGVARVEASVEGPEPIVWLAGQSFGERRYWSDRQRRFASAGVGIAAVKQQERVEAETLFGEIGTLLGREERARFYGGMRFDDERRPEEHWRGFGGARFVLPRFEMLGRDGEATLAVNLVFPEDAEKLDEILFELQQLHFVSAAQAAGGGSIQARVDVPGREEWMATVASAVEEIRAGAMEKIVLARESRFEMESEPDPVHLAGQLEVSAPGCFVFCHQVADGGAFLGATPERLYRREGRTIESEALAGTRRRGETEEADTHLAEKLLASRKEAREQGLVAEAVQRALAELCGNLRGGEEREIVKLARVQHMVTRFSGELKDGTTDATVLTRLHPTPAVGGVPTPVARERIRARERFDRGWYAGPVGWIGADSAEFAVGIRSALLRGSTLRLYSGAGIVEGSHPDKEWDEIENKIDNFLKLLASP